MLGYQWIYIVNKDHERESKKEVDIQGTANLSFVRENKSKGDGKRETIKKRKRV